MKNLGLRLFTVIIAGLLVGGSPAQTLVLAQTVKQSVDAPAPQET